jgi:uncharacterized protein YlaI
MILYLSKCNDTLNTKPLNNEFISDYLCLNPKYKVTLKKEVKVLLDSGAFQDREKNSRISFEDALNRQLQFERKVGFISERIVAYDYMDNVEETINANKFLVSKREKLKPRQLVLMVQGVTTRDYIHCLTETLKIAKSEDTIGFGGVALAGKINNLKFKLWDAFKIGLPIIYNSEIKNIHIFGVGTFDVLKEIKQIKETFRMVGLDVDQLNISCDTSSFELNSTMGRVINEDLEKWEKIYTKAQKYIDYHPADLTQENMKKALRIINNY